MNYSTTDFSEAVILKTLGYNYLGCKKIDRGEKTSVSFTYDITSSSIEEINKDYFNHVLQVDAYDCIESVKFIRKEIYNNRT